MPASWSCKKLTTLVHYTVSAATLVTVLCLCLNASGQWQEWTDANETHDWSDPGNWTNNRVSNEETDGVTAQVIPEPTIVNRATVVKSVLQISMDNDGQLTIGERGSLDGGRDGGRDASA